MSGSPGPNAPEPITQLDWVIPVLRVAEAVAMSFARAMGAGLESTTLHHAFRWDGLV